MSGIRSVPRVLSSALCLCLLAAASGLAGEVRYNDCNNNDEPDICDIDCDAPGCDPGLLLAGSRCGESLDCNGNWIPDECELDVYDCNDNGTPDDCDIINEVSLDANRDGIPDECQSGMPTVSEWSLVVLALLILTAGTLAIQMPVPSRTTG
ncbi:MAG: hypothetical protein JSU63_03040 [Phycisphaerales bacterium]|nr:MAG: hypothetical protein JSU63_03040 [Phycisphaerales bacterium]